jgi:hypothetical protein
MSVNREQQIHGFSDRVMSSFIAKKLDNMAQVGQSKGDAEGRQNPQHRQLHPPAD